MASRSMSIHCRSMRTASRSIARIGRSLETQTEPQRESAKDAKDGKQITKVLASGETLSPRIQARTFLRPFRPLRFRAEVRFSASSLDPQHLRRMLARGVRDLHPTQHASDLFYALVALEHRYAAHGHAFRLTLGHLPLMVGGGSDLRQMRDAHD